MIPHYAYANKYLFQVGGSRSTYPFISACFLAIKHYFWHIMIKRKLGSDVIPGCPTLTQMDSGFHFVYYLSKSLFVIQIITILPMWQPTTIWCQVLHSLRKFPKYLLTTSRYYEYDPASNTLINQDSSKTIILNW